MNVVATFDKVTSWMRNVSEIKDLCHDIKIERELSYEDAVCKLKEFKVKPGELVFFWNRANGCVDHVAMVMDQDETSLNLYSALLVNATPPPIGKANGPLSKPIDYSGVRIVSVGEYLAPNPDIYSRIIVGSPEGVNGDKLLEAGKHAKAVALSGLINGRPAVYSLPVIGKFFFIKWFNYKNHASVKLGTLRSTRHIYTYCGDLAGRIYEKVGIKNMPKNKVLGISGYQSSTFYEWFRDKKSLSGIVIWNEKDETVY